MEESTTPEAQASSKCQYCGFEVADALLLDIHCSTSHPISHYRTLRVNKQHDAQPQAADCATEAKRQKARRPFVCHQCGRAFAYAAGLQRHRGGHRRRAKAAKKAAGAKALRCARCGKRLRTLKGLRLHERYAHGVALTYECGLCPAVLRTKALHTEHVHTFHRKRAAHKDRQCDVCGRVCQSATGLAAHRRVHFGKRYKVHQAPGKDAVPMHRVAVT